MLEGAKSIGAGAATIASAVAALCIGNVLSSLIHSVARNPYNMKKILRPLPPHLTLFMSQLTSTFPISHRISGAFLATIVLFSPILCPKMGLICLTHQNFYQSLPNSSKFLPILVGLTAFALGYHIFCGVRHLVKYVLNLLNELAFRIHFIYITNHLVRKGIFSIRMLFLAFIFYRAGSAALALCLDEICTVASGGNPEPFLLSISPVPSLSGESDSWIERTYGTLVSSSAAENPGEAAPEPSTSSTWSGSWIDKWLNPEGSSSAPNEGGHEVTSQQPRVMEPAPAAEPLPAPSLNPPEAVLPAYAGTFPEFNRLAILLNQPDQDPEWVRYVYSYLGESTEPTDFGERARRFLSMEEATAWRRLIENEFYLKCKKDGFHIPQESVNLSITSFLEEKGWEFDDEKLRSFFFTMKKDTSELQENDYNFYAEVWKEDNLFLSQIHMFEKTRLIREIFRRNRF